MTLHATLYTRVPGVPVPKGSMTGLWSPSASKVIVKHNSPKLKGWQEDIGWMVRGEMNRVEFTKMTGPVDLKLTFWMPGGRFLGDKTGPMVETPDLDKLVRAVLDALTGILYVDDKQVVRIYAAKYWATELDTPGLEIRAEHAKVD